MSLPAIEMELLRTLPALNLRPTLDAAIKAGKLLVRAKELVEHGQWMNWLKRLGMTQQTAHDYQACYLHAEYQRPAADMTIKSFLEYVRRVHHLSRVAERERVRAEVAAQLGNPADTIVLAHADCRRYEWPGRVDSVCTDPPWADLGMYNWLAGWAAEHVAPSGPILVQCGTAHLPKIMSILAGAGLTYVWTMVFWYMQSSQAKATIRFRATWRPVLVYTVGSPGLTGETMADGYTVRAEPKPLHAWEQPVEPIRYWLSKLLRPGSLVADPFTGSGTTAVACRELALRFVGTEIDEKTYKVARGRLAAQERGQWHADRHGEVDSSPPAPAAHPRRSS